MLTQQNFQRLSELVQDENLCITFRDELLEHLNEGLNNLRQATLRQIDMANNVIRTGNPKRVQTPEGPVEINPENADEALNDGLMFLLAIYDYNDLHGGIEQLPEINNQLFLNALNTFRNNTEGAQAVIAPQDEIEDTEEDRGAKPTKPDFKSIAEGIIDEAEKGNHEIFEFINITKPNKIFSFIHDKAYRFKSVYRYLKRYVSEVYGKELKNEEFNIPDGMINSIDTDQFVRVINTHKYITSIGDPDSLANTLAVVKLIYSVAESGIDAFKLDDNTYISFTSSSLNKDNYIAKVNTILYQYYLALIIELKLTNKSRIAVNTGGLGIRNVPKLESIYYDLVDRVSGIATDAATDIYKDNINLFMSRNWLERNMFYGRLNREELKGLVKDMKKNIEAGFISYEYKELNMKKINSISNNPIGVNIRDKVFKGW